MAMEMKTESKEEEEEMIELGNLCNNAVESIFTKIPLKSLVQLKSVSKTWRNHITRIRHCYPVTTSTGLVLLLKHQSSQESIFLKLHDQPQKISGQFCSYTHNFNYLVDSCNGLLLYASHNAEFWTYSVHSPVLDQYVRIPPSNRLSRPACSSLAFNGSNEFRIICFFWEEVDFDTHMMNFQIFSSRTWKWRETKGRILNSNLLLQDGFVKGQCFNPSVCFGERLYWIWSLCLLVYDDHDGSFTLFQLPRNHSKKSRKGAYSQLIFESEGQIQFCDPVNNGFFIWTFRENEVDDSPWRFKKFVRLQELVYEKYQLRLTMGYSIRPCAFNKDLQVLYLQVMPHIVSYSFETQKLVQVWSYGGEEEEEEEEEDKCYICKIHPFLFSSVNLLEFNKIIGQLID